tara:strand:+ start:387 stop:557 length:171 start_codon:yes stop_codon:yes gene_type:complete
MTKTKLDRAVAFYIEAEDQLRKTFCPYKSYWEEKVKEAADLLDQYAIQELDEDFRL